MNPFTRMFGDSNEMIHNAEKVRFVVGLALVFVLLGVFLIYRPALNGPFVFDDGPNILMNKALHLSSVSPKDIRFALESVHAGPFGRPVANLSFALNYYFFGPETYSFKLVNLIIHLLNGVCVFSLTRLLLRALRLGHRVCLDKQRIEWLALATSALWLLHPLALTSVLYIVQRMASLAALFSFLSFIYYFSGRLKQFTGKKGIPQFLAAFGLFAPLAVFSKENAILIPFFLVAADWLLLGFKSGAHIGRLFKLGLLAAAVIALFAGLSVWDNFLDSLLSTYVVQPFTLPEHVLTETRVLWFYLKLVFLPNPADFGLYHDDIALSKGLFQPITTILSIAGLLALGAGALIFRKKAPVFSFAICFFLIGHSIESSIFSLEIAHEHRNYLPMYGLIFMLTYYWFHPRLIHRGGHAMIPGFILVAGMISTITINRAADWKDIGSLSLSLAEHHPRSARSNYEAGRLFESMVEDDVQAADAGQYADLARRYFTQSYRSDEFNPAGLFGILYLDSLFDKPVDSAILAELKRQLAKKPVMPATSISFSGLHQCHEKGPCRIDTAVLITLYESALSNPRASNQTRASLYNELAMLKLEQGDAFSAISFFKQSIALTPG
ncbi:MAG: hypothetical protein ACU843_03485, partial [Gammaproteobacteria bacterium]